MHVLSLTQASFDAAVARSACMVIEFSSRRADFADRAALADATLGVQWGHVDAQAETRLAAMFGIESDVALLVFREQIVLYRQAGRHDPAQMTALLRRICALDMAKIKAEIEEQKQAERALQMRRECPTTRLISESHRKAG